MDSSSYTFQNLLNQKGSIINIYEKGYVSTKIKGISIVIPLENCNLVSWITTHVWNGNEFESWKAFDSECPIYFDALYISEISGYQVIFMWINEKPSQFDITCNGTEHLVRSYSSVPCHLEDCDKTEIKFTLNKETHLMRLCSQIKLERNHTFFNKTRATILKTFHKNSKTGYHYSYAIKTLFVLSDEKKEKKKIFFNDVTLAEKFNVKHTVFIEVKINYSNGRFFCNIKEQNVSLDIVNIRNSALRKSHNAHVIQINKNHGLAFILDYDSTNENYLQLAPNVNFLNVDWMCNCFGYNDEWYYVAGDIAVHSLYSDKLFKNIQSDACCSTSTTHYHYIDELKDFDECCQSTVESKSIKNTNKEKIIGKKLNQVNKSQNIEHETNDGDEQVELETIFFDCFESFQSQNSSNDKMSYEIDSALKLDTVLQPSKTEVIPSAKAEAIHNHAYKSNLNDRRFQVRGKIQNILEKTCGQVELQDGKRLPFMAHQLILFGVKMSKYDLQKIFMLGMDVDCLLNYSSKGEMFLTNVVIGGFNSGCLTKTERINSIKEWCMDYSVDETIIQQIISDINSSGDSIIIPPRSRAARFKKIVDVYK